MNKNGSARDIILLVLILFTLSISFFASNFVGSIIGDQLQNNTGWNDSIRDNFNASQGLQDTLDVGQSFMDMVIFGVFLGLVFSILITSYLVGSNKVFMVFYFLFIIIAVVISIIFSDLFVDIFENATYYDFGTTYLSFPITMNLLTYMPYYIVVIGIIGMIIMFAKQDER